MLLTCMAPKRTKKKQPVKGRGPFRGRAVGHSRRGTALSPTRKRAKTAASVDHQQLRYFIEQAPVAIAILDREMRYLALSDRWKTDYGVTGQVLGRSHYEVFPEIPERWKEVHRRGLAGEIVSADEDPFPRNDGSVQWITWEVRPWYLDNDVGGITIMAEDVTLRVQARLAVEENEERLRQVLEKTHTGMWDWEIGSGRVYWTSESFLLLGYKPGSVIPSYDRWATRVHPADREKTETEVHDAMAQRREYHRQFRVLWPDGTIRWIEAHGTFRYDRDGQCERMIGLMRDITERVLAEAALSESRERIQFVGERAGVGYWYWDIAPDRLEWSPLCKQLFGIPIDEPMSYARFLAAVHPDDRIPTDRAVHACLESSGAQSYDIEYRTQWPDGTVRWIHAKGNASFEQGRPVRMAGITLDITEQKQAEFILQRNEAFIEEVLNSLSAHVCVLDRHGVIIRTNEPWQQFARANSDSNMAIGATGDNYLDVCRRAVASGDTTVGPILAGIEAVLTGKRETFSAEYPCNSPDEDRWFLLRVSPLRDTQGGVLSHLDISDRKRVEETLLLNQWELEKSQTQLQDLTTQLLQAQETERRRLARDLHDDLTQRIAALAIDLQNLRPALSESEATVLTRVHQLGKVAEQITTDLQQLAHQLHPSLLEHVGLEAAALEYLEEFERRTSVRTNVVVRKVPASIALDRAVCLYRVLQESLQNVRKHANATHVLVRLVGTRRGVGVCIHDNGCGFDFAQEISKAGRKGLGLISLQERIGIFGGMFRIKTKPGDGTEIHAWVPLNQRKGDTRTEAGQ